MKPITAWGIVNKENDIMMDYKRYLIYPIEEIAKEDLSKIGNTNLKVIKVQLTES